MDILMQMSGYLLDVDGTLSSSAYIKTSNSWNFKLIKWLGFNPMELTRFAFLKSTFEILLYHHTLSGT